MYDPVLRTTLNPILTSLLQSNSRDGSILLQILNRVRDLTLVKQWHKIDIRRFGDIHYIVGMHKEGDELQIVIPLSTSSVLSMNQITHQYASIPDPNFPTSTSTTTNHVISQITSPVTIRQFTFGIVDADSTLVYYKIHFNLSPPKE